MKEMRRADKQMPDETVEKVLTNGIYGFLATSDEEGQAYATPVNYIYENGKIYIHCASVVGQKLSNIMQNAKVSFTVTESVQVLDSVFNMKFQSVMAFGTAAVLNGIEDKKAVLTKVLQKYSPDFLEKGMKYIDAKADATVMIVIDVQRKTGKQKL